MEPVVAIDGPSGAGKSSVARAIAVRGGWRYLDTGSLYRAMTLGLLGQGLALVKQEREKWICANASKNTLTVDSSPAAPKIFLNALEVSGQIRSEEVVKNVSEVSALPCVRSRLLALQHELIAPGGIVVEGRDIGSVVWPKAQVKFYLTADLTARAQRRHAEIPTAVALDSVEGSLAQRDQIDSTRAASPLTVASDAKLIDTTDLTFEEVVELVWNEIERELAS